MRQVLMWGTILLAAALAAGQQVTLTPADPEALGVWALAIQPLRLRLDDPAGVTYGGPELRLQLWGQLSLGEASYALVLGVGEMGVPGVWLDGNRDGVIETEELLSGGRGEGFYLWQTTLEAVPPGGGPYEYPLGVLWPEGRGYVYLIGGAPRQGTFSLDGGEHRLVLLDADLDGVFGSAEDFYAVDTDRDGTIYGGRDGHERFALEEAFTIGAKSFRPAQIAPDGSSLTLEETEYVPPKLPLIPGYPAPDFSFIPFRGGEELSLADFRGKVVLLHFWATWCSACMRELPNVISIYQEFHGQGFDIIGISLDTSESDLRSVLEERGIPWPQYFDGKGWGSDIAAQYRIFRIPATLLLDRAGIIRYRDLRGEELREKVAELLAEPPPGEAPPEEAPEEIVEEPPLVLPNAEPGLEVSMPARVGILPGGTAELLVELENTSPHLAEEITLSFSQLPPGITVEPAELAELPGFAQRELVLTLHAAEGLEPGERQATVLVAYHYCIGESCFQMSDEQQLVLAVGEEPVAVKAPARPWWLLALLGVGIALAWLLFGKGASALSLVLVLLAGAALGVGVYLGQARQAQLIGAVICTSCVGIEEGRHDTPVLSQETRAALAEISTPMELVLFHTPWCRSCPYAIAMAQEFAAASPLIRVELVDAEENTDRAIQAGVFRSGRLIVPAILNSSTGEVIFGMADLEARLLALVQEGL